MSGYLDFIKERRVKYAHFFPVSGIFSNSFVSFINSGTLKSKPDEHIIFVEDTNNISRFTYANVFPVEDLHKKQISIMEETQSLIKYFVIHFLYYDVARCIPDNLCSKIIWRTWGNDLSYTIAYFPTIKLKIKAIIKKAFWKLSIAKNVRKFAAIGISASECDVFELKRQKIPCSYYPLPYISDYMDYKFADITSSNFGLISKDEDETWIMIGHSANSSLNHIRFLRILSHLNTKKIRFILPLVYGRSEYKETIISYLKKHNEINAYVLEDRLDSCDYMRFLNLVDIAIFDSKKEMALGNIFILLGLNKAVVLNKKGIVYKTLHSKGIEVYSTSELRNIQIDKLKVWANESKPNATSYAETILTRSYVKKCWDNLFERYE